MTRYKAIISYDGTNFAGFQTQREQRTVQQEIEKVLTKINSHQEVILQGSGRTDSGVHAKGQVVHFDLAGQRDIERIRFALDTQSPDDIAFVSLEEVVDDFHARFNRHVKTYEYYLEHGQIRSPFNRLYNAFFRYPLDIEKMRLAAKSLEGTHDFTGFTAAGATVEDKVRTIYEASVSEIEDGRIKFTFRGNGFLYKQVRNMVGTLIKIGNDRMPVEQIDLILDSQNRKLAGPTAQPEGLFLKEVIYLDENDENK